MTREEIVQTLLRGESVQIGSGASDAILLATPRACLLASAVFDHLRLNSVESLKEDQTFFEILEGTDTATEDLAPETDRGAVIEGIGSAPCWRLLQVRTREFGGLNTIGGEEFLFDVDTESWLIEGQNGTGKSSLANALLFAMTGTFYRDQLGLVADPTKAAPVFDGDGNQIAEWPPIVSYPRDWSSEAPDIDLSVELTFQDKETGEETVARRTIKGQVGQLRCVSDIDQRLRGLYT
ncbi:MAG: AAA family ATPase [Proteobacteria bacterium]|nr:AAA family ATPase [Pseudomonadota bacterium]